MNKERDVRKENLVKELEATGILTEKSYYKNDVETELRAFQEVLVSKVFEETHARNLRMADVKCHVNELAQYRGVADREEITRFNGATDMLAGIIAKELAGNNGERYMNRSLEAILVDKEILCNIELSDQYAATELDAVVVTRKGIFLLEAKRPKSDVCIDEAGNYWQKGKTDKICNIGEKMNQKAGFLRKILCKQGIKKINIISVVVFTNSEICVEDKYEYFDSCYCSQLPHYIAGTVGRDIYTLEEMQKIREILEQEHCPGKYQLAFDFNEYRKIFADAVALIEFPEEEPEEIEKAEEQKRMNWKKAAMYGAMSAGWVLVALSKVAKKH